MGEGAYEALGEDFIPSASAATLFEDSRVPAGDASAGGPHGASSTGGALPAVHSPATAQLDGVSDKKRSFRHSVHVRLTAERVSVLDAAQKLLGLQAAEAQSCIAMLSSPGVLGSRVEACCRHQVF